jgi:hypothetical protein
LEDGQRSLRHASDLRLRGAGWRLGILPRVFVLLSLLNASYRHGSVLDVIFGVTTTSGFGLEAGR